MQDPDAYPQLSESDARTVGLLVREVANLDEDALREYPWRPATSDEAVTGLRLGGHESTLAQLRTSVEGHVSPNSVWMDATTLYRVRRLLADDTAAGRRVFDPLALLDLDVFIRNFLLYDQILSVRDDPASEWGDMRPLNESMHEAVFVALLPDGPTDPRVDELFHHLFFRARDWVTQAVSGRADIVMTQQFAAWRSSAQKIYGAVPDERTEMRLIQDWGSVADYVAQLLMSPDRPQVPSVMMHHDEDLQHKLIAEATVRAIFNADLSRGLGVRYSPAAARLPTVAAFDMARAFTAVDALSALMKELRDERLEGLDRVHRDVAATPAWVSVLLSRAQHVTDLWPELVGLRQETSALRLRRSALNEELNGAREEETLAELRKALRAESHNLLAAWGASGAKIALGVTASVLMGGPWGFGFVAGLAAMLGAELLSDHPQRLRTRLAQPRQTQVAHLGSQVAGLRQSLPKAQRLWGVDDALVRDCAEAYARMEKIDWL